MLLLSAYAMLLLSAYDGDIRIYTVTYTSTPLNASLIVLVCTSVIVVSFIFFVSCLTILGCTRPRVARSWNSVTGPSSARVSTVSSAATACCHFADRWNPAIEILLIRKGASLGPAVGCARGNRTVRVRRAVADKFLETAAGHLRRALNMMAIADSPPRSEYGYQINWIQAHSE
jgi:hypothetical protein